MSVDLIVIGGGAAGFFAALAAKEAQPDAKVILLEKTSGLLGKVRISGGGRCNVTHACFDPKELVKNYPRGHRELLGPFTRFQPQDTIAWFHARGVELKTESDGRMFPTTDSSQTIIDCLMHEASKKHVEIRLRQQIDEVKKQGDHFLLSMGTGEVLETRSLLLATGSNPQGFLLAKSLGHTIQDSVPSLFTFNVPTSQLKALAGVSVGLARLHLEGSAFQQMGPLLITHWGFSGPAALKLSAWAARYLHGEKYRVTLVVNWVEGLPKQDVIDRLKSAKIKNPQQTLLTSNPFHLPKNLWKALLEQLSFDSAKRLSDVSHDQLQKVCDKLIADSYQVEGKTTNKEEFVTCGGITLSEVNFKTMESKLMPGLFFSGEILDIDGVTGGFNFQNAWTTAWLAGQHSIRIISSSF